MKRIRGFTASVLTLLIMGLWNVPARADVGIEATVTPSQVAVGEPLTLNVVVSGATAGVKPPRMPAFANFRSYSKGQSQEISFIEGRMTNRSVFTYVLIPTLPGKHVLGQLEVEIGGRIYKTGVLEVEVLDTTILAPRPGALGKTGKGLVVAPAPRSLPPEYLAGKDIFVRTWVNQDEVFVNEPIYLTYTVYTRVSATFRGFDKEPQTEGFWVEEFPPEISVNRKEKEIGGYRYVVADVRTVALFPTEAGSYTLDPGILKVEVEIYDRDDFDSFFSMDIFGRRAFRRPASILKRVEPRLLDTDPIPITVKPIPEEGKPADFNGAVGAYQLEATIDRQEVEEGEPVTYTLRLVGEGNLTTVTLPKLSEMEYFKQYDSSSGLSTRKDRLVVEGEKVSETVLVPKRKGDYTIPSLAFSYFDPRKKEYQTLQTKPLSLKVRPGREEAEPPLPVSPVFTPQEVSMIGEDIRYIRTSIGRILPEHPPVITHPIWWLLHFIYGALAVLVFGIRLAIEWAYRDTASIRLRRSWRVACRHLAEAQGRLKKGMEREFYESLSIAFYGYFADKLDLGPGEIGMDFLEEKLSEKIGSDRWAGLKDIANRIQSGRFAGSLSDREAMKSLLKATRETLSTLERKRFL